MKKILKLSNEEPKEYLKGFNSGKEYELTKKMYGCLDVSGKTPLSAVCVTGNSFSIDPWTGCSFQCAYCHVQGVAEDLNEIGKMRTIPERRNRYDDLEICEALVRYPLFDKDDSVISIGTSSTEPFAKGVVLESTLKIMEWFVENEYKNPFFFFSKAGIPDMAVERLEKISKTNRIAISICYGNNNSVIEPAQNNRFLNIEKFECNKNIFCNWYFRPLVYEWNKDGFNFDNIFKEISEKYGKYIKAVVPGGLRWTEGIEYGLKEIRGIELPKDISEATRHEKSLTLDDLKRISKSAQKYFKETPVFNHSACMMSWFLNRNNIAMIKQRYPEECEVSFCPEEQRAICSTKISLNIKKINRILKDKGINIKFTKIIKNQEEYFFSEPNLNEFCPAIRQRIIYYLSICMESSRGII